MEFSLNLSPKVNHRSLEGQRMNDPIASHQSHRTWWSTQFPHQMKFPCSVMGGSVHGYVVGGFIGSKSQRNDEKQHFPIGTLISHCLKDKPKCTMLSQKNTLREKLVEFELVQRNLVETVLSNLYPELRSGGGGNYPYGSPDTSTVQPDSLPGNSGKVDHKSVSWKTGPENKSHKSIVSGQDFPTELDFSSGQQNIPVMPRTEDMTVQPDDRLNFQQDFGNKLDFPPENCFWLPENRSHRTQETSMDNLDEGLFEETPEHWGTGQELGRPSDMNPNKNHHVEVLIEGSQKSDLTTSDEIEKDRKISSDVIKVTETTSDIETLDNRTLEPDFDSNYASMDEKEAENLLQDFRLEQECITKPENCSNGELENSSQPRCHETSEKQETSDKESRKEVKEFVQSCLDAIIPPKYQETLKKDAPHLVDCAVDTAFQLFADIEQDCKMNVNPTNSAFKSQPSKETVPLSDGNCQKTGNPTFSASDSQPSKDSDPVFSDSDCKMAVNTALSAARCLFYKEMSPKLNEFLVDTAANFCVRLLSESSADSNDDIVFFDENPCALTESEEEEWSEDEDYYEEDEDDRIRDATSKWTTFYGKSPPGEDMDRETQVKFDPDVEVHVMRVWDFASRKARLSPWEQAARDRVRFAQRIARSEPILAPILNPAHRKKVQQRMEEETIEPSTYCS